MTTGSTKTVFANAVTGCFCGETVGVTAWSSTRGAAFARGSGARARFRDLKPNMAPDRRAREGISRRESGTPRRVRRRRSGARESRVDPKGSSAARLGVRRWSTRDAVCATPRIAMGIRAISETPFRAGQRLWARARTFGSCDRPPPSRAPRRRDDDHGGRRRETGEARGERRCLLELRAGQPLDAERGVLRLSLSRRLVDLRACARDDDARALRVGVPRLSPRPLLGRHRLHARPRSPREDRHGRAARPPPSQARRSSRAVPGPRAPPPTPTRARRPHAPPRRRARRAPRERHEPRRLRLSVAHPERLRVRGILRRRQRRRRRREQPPRISRRDARPRRVPTLPPVPRRLSSRRDAGVRIAHGER